MISDVLFEAIKQIREYQWGDGNPYGSSAEEIENVVAVMDALELLYECPFGFNEEHQALLDDVRAELKALTNSGVITARKRLLEWVQRERQMRKRAIQKKDARKGSVDFESTRTDLDE